MRGGPTAAGSAAGVGGQRPAVPGPCGCWGVRWRARVARGSPRPSPHAHGPQEPPAQPQPVPQSCCAAEAPSPRPCSVSPASSPGPRPVQTPGDRSPARGPSLSPLAQRGHTWTRVRSSPTAAPRTAAGRTGHGGPRLRLENLVFRKPTSQLLASLPGTASPGMSAAGE